MGLKEVESTFLDVWNRRHREGDHHGKGHSPSRITYYLGWLAAVLGALSHFVLGPLFVAIKLSQRNLYEAGVLFFIICMASELRTRGAASNVISSVPRRQAA
jgi:hypothetical protein